MKNDVRDFKIDEEFQDLVVDDKVEVVFDLTLYIQTYIKVWEIGSVGVTIVMNNAIRNMSEPSDKGTMRNLYVLFRLYILEKGKK